MYSWDYFPLVSVSSTNLVKFVFRINSRFILSLAALYAERAGDGGEDGDEEVDDGFDVFFFHTIWDDWWLMISD